MEPWQKKALDKNLVLLAESMDLVELLPFLQQESVLREHHVDSIKKKSAYEGRLELISIIKRRGPMAFQALCDGLAFTGQAHLKEKLFSVEGRAKCLAAKKEDAVLDIVAESVPLNKSDCETFYAVESLLCNDVPATDGLLERLRVEESVAIPPDYNEAECYKNSSRPKGLALIINNRHFRGLPERLGSDVDSANLQRLFKQLGYVVKSKQDLTKKDMIESMLKFALKKEHERCHSAVVVILSHGLHGEIYGCDGLLISIDRIIEFLDGHNCPALLNKPKLFFIQACRGERYDAGRDVIDFGDEYARLKALRKLVSMDESDASELRQKIPAQADILIAYATIPGYVSWRNSLRGSWFVQAICEIFSTYAHKEEVLHLLTRVNNYVASKMSSCGHVQVPEPCSRLRKKMYFLPGYYE